MWHGATNVVMVTLFVVSWLLRANAPGDPGFVAIVLSFVVVGLTSLGGFLGGELVVRLGVGVVEGAHLNATSSLSGRPVGRSSTGAERGIGKAMSGSRRVRFDRWIGRCGLGS